MAEKKKIENKAEKKTTEKKESVVKDRRPKKIKSNKAFDTEIVGTGKSPKLPKNEVKLCTKSAAKILVDKGFATIVK